ncbi:Short-chain dehydrogenase/reductase SDR [Trichormus variabilis ATCC 29413]|uniref:Short-chain dehydrogenase/reductase SDR n=2 Tax=Anabaena variabilis TaxID=264691 RepID=Q3M9C2_TRIV2|nr:MULTISPECIES: SDR family oxidoreductase [Nostocaceae]ABA22414.1 Short-chain dehydrogenase/reductase SDR [Trichormus variabilis ATCC 29413]MBC1214939.1 SDR family oxidoreductase [Trichormus variabilis ARAD]MBC1258516.1 SDR family oxidoreductase [Trichormus variabilis V5]MBC1268551.1 SDR family oxidoreductase [Trichormus variabilis FSR]MBC1304324.1 SDR family oxidoreductase [Trichormus variabilis N2B]
MTEQKRIAVITGSNRGLGYAISRKLAQIGLHVILTSRNEADGLAAKQQLSAEGLDADYCVLDVTNDVSVQRFTKWLRETYSKVDILVNNAGINPTTKPEESSLLTVQLETMRVTWETNVLAVVRITQALIPLMQVENYGRIVNISTEMASLSSISDDYYPLAPSYRLSKVGVNGITAILAKELQGTNILVNAYSPGWMKTDMGGDNAPFTAEEGAETAVYLATLPDGGVQGQFFAEMRKFGGPVQLQW